MYMHMYQHEYVLIWLVIEFGHDVTSQLGFILADERTLVARVRDDHVVGLGDR